MTSYSWNYGNIYNGIKDPSYRAISYTWGRWRLGDDERPEIDPIQIAGTPWKIPRIDPAHFSTKQMHSVIQSAAKGDERDAAFLVDAPNHMIDFDAVPKVDFVWLDIACIDQRWGPLAALEVGRQAKIFKNATRTAIWLSHTGIDDKSYKSVQTFIETMVNDGLRFRFPYGQDWQQSMLQGIEELLQDPWFSSLWTLQEAFLSDSAYFLTANGRILEIVGPLYNESSPVLFHLGLLLYVCHGIDQACAECIESPNVAPHTVDFIKEWNDWMKKCGFVVMAGANSLGLIGAAGHRVSSQIEDRIYAIMQVFDYRLGTSRDQLKSFNLLELMDELGHAILSDRPCQSQLHAFSSPSEPGTGWHANFSSVIPHAYSWPLRYSDEDLRNPEIWQPLVEFSTESVADTLFGRFKGRVCRLETISQVWLHAIQRIIPDACDCLPNVDELHRFSLRDASGESRRYLEFCHRLTDQFVGSTVVVLAVTVNHGIVRGLFLVHVQVANIMYWHRLGTCQWLNAEGCWDGVPTPGSKEQKILDMVSNDWIEVDGLFG